MATRAISLGKKKRTIPDLLLLGNTHICSCSFAPRKTLPESIDVSQTDETLFRGEKEQKTKVDFQRLAEVYSLALKRCNCLPAPWGAPCTVKDSWEMKSRVQHGCPHSTSKALADAFCAFFFLLRYQTCQAVRARCHPACLCAVDAGTGFSWASQRSPGTPFAGKGKGGSCSNLGLHGT